MHLTAEQIDRRDELGFPDRRIPRWRREEMEQARYERLYEEIEARLIDEETADGANEDYKPSGARVHELVLREMKRRGE